MKEKIDITQNMDSIGICYIGGLSVDKQTPEDTRTKEQKTAIIGLVNSLIRKYQKQGIILTVHGHNEYAKKACPCFNVKKNGHEKKYKLQRRMDKQK